MTWQERYVRRFYRSKPGWRDGNEEFQNLLSAHIPPESSLLEIGPGEGSETSEMLSNKLGCRVTGLDIDDAICRNPYVHTPVLYDGLVFPFKDCSFDAAVADYVLEHIREPAPLLKELSRVLRPGGIFCFRTPNKWHYVALAGRVLPDGISRWARRKAQSHRVYKKYFRFNTRRECLRSLGETNFDVIELRLVEKEPSYGMASLLLFFPMMVYERLVNLTPALAALRANILGCARRRP